MNPNQRMTRILVERERLTTRCDAQRAEISVIARQWEGPLSVADRAIMGINYLRDHPLVLGGAVALLVVFQRRGWWSWARRGYMLWRAYRAFGNGWSRATI